ncbi:MAG: cysteine--tRNA ligase [Gammaproteobacteria bacterium]|jgi:cysteinyl-tRNA synthetase|nr:cysteine--tRNA ligase [Gammaproteobacteria bacterium]
MTLSLHNTMTGEKEAFTPLNPDRVTIYVCGPTVYNYVHIGNARPVVVFDVLYRLLSREYPEVVYARNITDVDDKINAAAKGNGEPISALAGRFADAFHEDMAALNTLPPSLEPRATENIEAMIGLIERLIAGGHAYAADGHVIYDVPSLESYGKLSHRKLEDMLAGARVEVESYKRNPADFVLWKPSTDELPGWDSPWGRGRPGWHTECAAMIQQHLGPTIDIHGGGQDLVFPHHENEIAQGTCAHPGADFVRYWVHNGYITVSGDKMSKSEGNFFTVRDLLAQFPGEAIRYALLSGHYRKPLDWSPEIAHQARASLDRLYQALKLANAEVVAADYDVPAEVVAALDDDLNTPLALSHLHEIASRLNAAGPDDNREVERLKRELVSAGALLGILQQNPESWFRWTPEDAKALSDEAVEDLVAERTEARSARNFARSDEIRDQLAAEGVQLEDSAAGTVWRRTGARGATT